MTYLGFKDENKTSSVLRLPKKIWATKDKQNVIYARQSLQ